LALLTVSQWEELSDDQSALLTASQSDLLSV
jgi:hypothetical protein